MNEALQDLESKYEQAQSNEEKLIALDRLLLKFPLLHGYWLKRIDLSADKTSEWKRALGSCPVLDLWINFLETPYGDKLENAEVAVNRFGYHYHAHPIWQMYIERSKYDHSTILRAIKVPLYAYAQFFQIAYEQNAASAEALEKLSIEVSAEVGKRWAFEDKLNRPYFHPQPVEDLELETWNEYLNYVESNASTNDEIIQLYERCLVTTALYSQIWIRYICWSVEHEVDSPEIYKTALRYHEHDSTIKALYSRFLELQGDLENARVQLQGNGKALAEFDFRNDLVPDATDPQYLITSGTQGDNAFRIRTHASQANVIDMGTDPKLLIQQWRQGKIVDAELYASRLREFGYLDLFFEVDATLGYTAS